MELLITGSKYGENKEGESVVVVDFRGVVSEKIWKELVSKSFNGAVNADFKSVGGGQ